MDDPVLDNVHFTIECHGVKPRSLSQSTYISSHWIKSCLEVCLKTHLFVFQLIDIYCSILLFFPASLKKLLCAEMYVSVTCFWIQA